ncbi:MAG: sigma 54-interacting transcriptional regulator [Bryobacteraceae bacterium]
MSASKVTRTAPRILIAAGSGVLSRWADEALVWCDHDSVDEALAASGAQGLLIAEEEFRDALPADLQRWRAARPELQTVFLFRTPPPTSGLTRLMRGGAFDIVEAPGGVPPEPAAREALEALRLQIERVHSEQADLKQARESLGEAGMIGGSQAMQDLFVQIHHAARLQCAVHITGEPGSGKRLAAYAIHQLSSRSGRPIVTVECGSLSPQLLDALLFGAAHGRGAMVRAAHRGTLYLREISETPYGVQQDLARLLDAPAESEIDLRVLSSASRRIDQLAQWKRFREDLCYRLNVLTIEIPSLRRRREDIPALARVFLMRQNPARRELALSSEALAALAGYHWPGNVRQLRDAIEHAAIHCPQDLIGPEHLPVWVEGKSAAPSTAEAFVSSELNLERLEHQAIMRALQVTGFDKAKTAKLLGIGKTTMYRKLKAMSARLRQ